MSMYKAQRLLAETMRNRRKQQREQQEQQQQPDDFVASNIRSFADKSYQNFRQQRRISQSVNQKDSQQQINGKRRQQPVREPLRQCSNNSQQQSLRRSVVRKLQVIRMTIHASPMLKSLRPTPHLRWRLHQLSQAGCPAWIDQRLCQLTCQTQINEATAPW
ncbi:hypothetical protein BOX15_Mlig031863g3 [Macrostomum lignano]|uniref:Uncharacterized protein n=1 Tax=Macrostomum lignano TaxID=282301 RepID=A0A267EEF1_9PLAT|nr:hypothetical protein BOX15_Mlig031863g3 [Macrostomum lignano]